MELLQKESSLKTHLLNLPLQPIQTELCGSVGFFDLVRSLLELNTFAMVGLFHRRRERWRYLAS
jgi:hypothetical protein